MSRRFVNEHAPLVVDLKKDELVSSIQKLFSCSPSDRYEVDLGHDGSILR